MGKKKSTSRPVSASGETRTEDAAAAAAAEEEDTFDGGASSSFVPSSAEISQNPTPATTPSRTRRAMAPERGSLVSAAGGVAEGERAASGSTAAAASSMTVAGGGKAPSGSRQGPSTAASAATANSSSSSSTKLPGATPAKRYAYTRSRPSSAQSSDDEDPMEAARLAALRRKSSGSDLMVQRSTDGAGIVVVKRTVVAVGPAAGGAQAEAASGVTTANNLLTSGSHANSSSVSLQPASASSATTRKTAASRKGAGKGAGTVLGQGAFGAMLSSASPSSVSTSVGPSSFPSSTTPSSAAATMNVPSATTTLYPGALAHSGGSKGTNSSNNKASGFSLRKISLLVVACAITFSVVFALMNLKVDAGKEPRAVKEWRERGYILHLNESNVEASIFVVNEAPVNPKLTVVFVHDAFDSSFSFQGAADMMVRLGVHVVLFDFPGFGLSPAPTPRHHAEVVQMHGVWLEEVLAALEVEEVAIIAQGTGLGAACAYAAKNPDGVSHIVSFGDSLSLRHQHVGTEAELGGISPTHILKFLYPLAFHQEECGSGSTSDSKLRAHAAATNYLALHHGRISSSHHLRQLLILQPLQCPLKAGTTKRMWLGPKHVGDLTMIHESRTAPVVSPSICLHQLRPSDFLLSVMSFFDPDMPALRQGKKF